MHHISSSASAPRSRLLWSPSRRSPRPPRRARSGQTCASSRIPAARSPSSASTRDQRRCGRARKARLLRQPAAATSATRLDDANALGIVKDALRVGPCAQPAACSRDAFVDDGFGLGVCSIGGFTTVGSSYWDLVVNHVTSSTGGEPDARPKRRPDPLVLHVGQRADLRARRTGAERAGTGKARQAVHGRGDPLHERRQVEPRRRRDHHRRRQVASARPDPTASSTRRCRTPRPSRLTAPRTTFPRTASRSA